MGVTVEVIIKHRHASEILEMVKDLRSQGLVQGKDFDFAFHSEQFDNFTGAVSHRHTIFSFYTEKYASLFLLKWS